jgi:peptide/nickel transport system ATP-binding protein
LSELLRINDLHMEGRLPDGGHAPIVRGVSVSVRRGQVLALIGESGAGKSTIALSSMAYARPGCRFTGGEVIFDGTSMLDLTLEEKRGLRGRRIAYVPQSAAAAFNAAHTLGEQIKEGPSVHRVMRDSEAQTRLEELAARMRLPDPGGIGSKYPHQVSGGQLQRLAAVMAMSCGPDLLVFDEPTTAIDVTTQVEVLAAFKDVITQSGAAAMYVTHDLAVVAQMADYIVVLRYGEVVEEGETTQILHDPQHAYTRELMAAVRPPPRATVTMPDRGDGMDAVLRVQGVNAGYGGARGAQVLFDVDMAVPRGEAVGMIGESGCGKSTMARVISGLLPPRSGKILLDDEPLPGGIRGRTRKQLQRVQLVLQMPDVSFNPKSTIGAAMGRPLEFYLGLTGQAKADRVAELLRMVDLPEAFAGRYPHELSGGQKQRVNLARALGAEPEVILCDEVTSALDTVVGAAIIELLQGLRQRLATAFVFISHDLSTVASFADRIVVLYAGRVAEDGPTAQVLSPPYHPYTRLLLSSVPEMQPGWLEEHRNTREVEQAMQDVVNVGLSGCPFHTRCPHMKPGLCDVEVPAFKDAGNTHRIACHLELEALTAD